MRKLKDVSVSLHGIDDQAFEEIVRFAMRHAKTFEIFVEDPGYDLVRDEPQEGPENA